MPREGRRQGDRDLGSINAIDSRESGTRRVLINTGKGINRGRCLSKSIGAAVKRRGEGEGQWREAIGVGIKGFGAGRFAFSIWRMLPPPSRISGPCKPREKPLLPA